MDLILEHLHKFSYVGIIALFFFEAIILFVRGKANLARRTMAYILLMWGVAYLFIFFSLDFHKDEICCSLFREKLLIAGNLYLVIIFFFPIQVVKNGWLTRKRILCILSPIIGMALVYYGVLYLIDEQPERLTSYKQLGESISHFNIWFRFVLLINNLVYIVLIMKWLYKQEQYYIKWKNNNFADQEYVDISWMRTYIVLMMILIVFYLGTLFIGGRIPILCHTAISIVAYSYLFYKALFYESLYPEDFCTYSNSSTGNQSEIVMSLTDIIETEHVDENSFDKSFEGKLPVYMESVKEWMDKEKPYLFNDFKLADVSRVLPLNRSYLSRVFNEGFGQSFNEVVRMYRVEYSKNLLLNNSKLPVYMIAELSGFNSDSTYLRAFKQITGMTPSKYKKLNLPNA